MGYAYYALPDGREAGYGVEATCDEPNCGARIGRGLGYLCGVDPGGDEYGCGDYFCGSHLYYGGPAQMCSRCVDAYEKANPEDD